MAQVILAESTEKHGKTEIKLALCRYEWTVSNFELLKLVGQKFMSTELSFFVETEEESKWQLHLYPCNATENGENVSVYLYLVSSKKPTVEAACLFSIISSEGKEVNTRRSCYFTFSKKNCSNGIKNFILCSELIKKREILLPNGTLTILCQVWVGQTPVTSTETIIPIEIPTSQLISNYSTLFKSQKFTDVTFSVEGREIKAHKAVLAARSKVFAAMFEHQMTETQNNAVIITDMGFNVLKKFLKYIYTGRVLKLDEMAIDLLAAAEKYELEHLKGFCEEALWSKLSTDNAAETLIHANRYNADQLKVAAIAFINKNGEKVMESEGWKIMLETQPALIAEIYAGLRKSLTSSNEEGDSNETEKNLSH